MKKIHTNIFKDKSCFLSAGDTVLLTGEIYTARDQAHKKLVDLLSSGRKLPLDITGKIIYYCGPTATPKGKVIGSCGPTTSRRMDKFVEPLLANGLVAMIGKGRRAPDVIKAVKKYQAVYLLAPAGCGALLAERVTAKELIAFKELGPEAIYKLTVDDFPLIVGVDSSGRDIYDKIYFK